MRELIQLATALRNLIRLGTVCEINAAKAKIRVSIGEIKTPWISWLTTRAGADKNWWPPSIGEQVVVLSPEGNLKLGIALGSTYFRHNAAPESNTQVHNITYSDGSAISYNKEQQTMSVSCVGKIVINAAKTMEIAAQNGINITSSAPINIKANDSVSINSSTEVNIAGPGVSLAIKNGTLTVSASNLKLAGNKAIARVGDTVQINIANGSSAGIHYGKITSGSKQVTSA